MARARRDEWDVIDAPSLDQVLVAPAAEVDSLIQMARASVARLTLELRATLRDVEETEREAASATVVDDEARNARQLLDTILDERLARRRVELDAEIDAARAHATELVASSRQAAAALLAAAKEHMLAVLLDDTRPTAPLRIVTTDTAPAPDPVLVTATPIAPAPPVAPVAPTPEVAPPPPPAPPSPAPAAPATAPADTTEAIPTRRFVARLLYVDVLLPLVAVFIVIAVLLAWLG